MKPAFRFGTAEAIEELAKELNLPNEDWMQDWSYIVADPDDIERYIDHYHVITDEDKRFVLMEMMIQATEEQPNKESFTKYCNLIEPILTRNFVIHEYTVYYWSCFDNDDLEDCWEITPFMRKIWKENRN